ncbi:hypothetical protein B0H13DRAFT_75499 [Mycena leptocephala]|nr:hypothetical protein B0H13DRAFT_75499 [Mycena leptocephala]
MHVRTALWPRFGAWVYIHLSPIPQSMADGNEPRDEGSWQIGRHFNASASYPGAFFPSSQQLNVSGGIFTSNVTTIAGDLPTGFRRIIFGDIDLQHEIRWNDKDNVVYHRRGRASVRRMYSAMINRQESNMTVGWYQGPDAEAVEWEDDVAQNSRLRHPNIAQLYGVASACPMYATVIHGDLIPLEQFDECHRASSSPILYLYFRAYWAAEFEAVNDYLSGVTQKYVDEQDCTRWIRQSSRRL